MKQTYPSPLRFVSFRQPWATFVLSGKDVENRTWPISLRGPLVVHASLSRADFNSRDARRLRVESDDAERYPRGVLLGVVDVLDCVRDSTSPWARKGQWHWMLDNPRWLSHPIECRGQLGIGILTPELRRRVLRAL